MNSIKSRAHHDTNPHGKIRRRSTTTTGVCCFGKGTCITPQRVLLLFMFCMGLGYIQFAVYIIKTSNNVIGDNGNSHNIVTTTTTIRGGKQQQQQRRIRANSNGNNDNNNPKLTYSEWKNFAVQLAGMKPSDIVRTLKKNDPFGVRTFEKKLLDTESEKGRFLSLQEIQEVFPCPNTERITLPEQRNNDKALAFRNGTKPFFLFFQHLRKAGGTNFCTLAEHNLKKEDLPPYYCMPDYQWDLRPQHRGAGYLTRYTNEDIVDHMKQKHHRIAGNEWDAFDSDRFFDLPATFATSFRKPLDRALSQFRFECIEDRGCQIKNVTKWWDHRTDLTNVYTWTFAKEGVRQASIGNKAQDAHRRQELIIKALDAVVKFNIVMVMEWLAYAPTQVTKVLGFQNTKTLTERVRPHISQAKRDDGQEHNKMGAAGISKASWVPEKYLPPKLYDRMSRDLALDEILNDAARRMFLERIVCSDVM